MDKIFIPYRIGTRDGSYVPGKYCRHYRLNTDWVKKYIKNKTIEHKEKVTNKDTININSEIRDGTVRAQRSLSLPTDKLNDKDTESFYTQEAENKFVEHYIKNGDKGYQYSEIKDGIVITRDTEVRKDEVDFKDMCSLYYSYYLKQSFTHLKEYELKIFRKRYEKRLYHSMTHFPKRLYKHLSFKGDPLMEIDISNCFPLLIINSFLNSQNKIHHYLYEEPVAIQFIEQANIIDSNENKLVISIRKGKFYETILEILNPYKNYVLFDVERDRIKQETNEVLYGSRTKYSKHKKNLERHFPTFMSIINLYKEKAYLYYKENPDSSRTKLMTKNGELSNFKAGNNSVSIYGMINESMIIIDQLLPKLYEKDLTVLSKHDSIIFPKSQYEKISPIPYPL